MTGVALTDAQQPPRRWWVLIAGVWFAVLSQVPILFTDQSVFDIAPTLAALIALTSFASGAICWWASFHRRFRFVGTAASFGVGTAMLSVLGLLLNPLGWGLLLPMRGFVFAPLFVTLLMAGGIVLRLAFLLSDTLWPNSTVERDARKSGARPSL